MGKDKDKDKTFIAKPHVEYDVEALRRHGGATLASPAAANRVAPPGPGTHDIGAKDLKLTRPNNANTKFAKTDRFKHIGPVLPGIDTGVPGPGSYEADSKICLGKYIVGTG